MTRGSHRRMDWPQEAAPCGEPGLEPVYLREFYRDPASGALALDDCLVSRPRPWSLVIWEPLRTKAPAPPKAQPHCCYINTVIFYHAPYIVWPKRRPWKSAAGWKMTEAGFLEWDRVRVRLCWDDVVRFQGEEFDVGGARVVWAQRRWWMLHGARRRLARAAA